MSEKTKTTYGMAIFFILCGLIIGILGCYECAVVKQYEGVISTDSVQAKELVAKYPEYVFKPDTGGHFSYIIENEGDLAYKFQDTHIINGLEYTTYSKFMPLAILFGLIYLWLGIATLVKKDFIYRKD